MIHFISMRILIVKPHHAHALQWRHVSVMALQITSNTIVCSTAYAGIQENIKALALCEGIQLVTGGFAHK